VELTYYVAPWDRDVEPDEIAEPAAADVHEIRHGYNLAGLERLTRIAVSRAITRGGDYQGRYEAAWSGIAEALCTAKHAPDRADLIAAGWRAVADYARAEAHHHGIDPETWGPLRGFDRYWHARNSPSPERRTVETTALWQIWPELSDRQREALATLAAVDDYEQATDSLGIAAGTFRALVSQGRRRFLGLWHEGEEPSQPWHVGRRIGHRHDRDRFGKPRITIAQLDDIRARYHAGETLSAIGADYGVKKACLSSLLSGRTKPAQDRQAS
jgi:hypothetical protein